MTDYILDASAVLAVLQNEPGQAKVREKAERSAVGRINATEVLTKLIENGAPLDRAILAFESLDLRIIEFNTAQSELIASLRPLTKHLGLSLGDRVCLALAILENATAVTADRHWKDLTVCPIQLIR